MDALFALSVLTLLSVAYVSLSSIQFETQKYASLDQEGRDYLLLAYVLNYNMTDEQFANLTGHNLSGGKHDWVWNFTGDADDWTAGVPDEWSRLNLPLGQGQITYAHTPGVSNADRSMAGGANWDHYYLLAPFQFNTHPASNKFMGGISARVNATGGRYACIAYSSTLVLLKLNASTDSVAYAVGKGLATASITGSYEENIWYNLTLNVSGTRINCTLQKYDNQITAAAFDAQDPILRGKVGLEGSSDTTTYFDNVTVLGMPSAVPVNASLALRASLLRYPDVCGCDLAHSTGCWVDNDSSCLQNQQRLETENFTKEVWVS